MPLVRRDFLRITLAATGGLAFGCARPRRPSIPPYAPDSPKPPVWAELEAAMPCSAPAIITSEKERPRIVSGVQCGDVESSRAIVWCRADRPAKMVVEWSASEAFEGAARVEGPIATSETDFTTRVDLDSLPADRKIYYRVTFEEPTTGRAKSEPALGSFSTAPSAPRDIRFVWGGDTAGQGWGINLAWGGMKIYEAMRRCQPDFFIHCGDMIYADTPIPAEIVLHDGTLWRNLVTAEKSKVAETLDDFRGNFAYNLLDENVRRFNAEVPTLVMWDDHEVHDNWHPDLSLERDLRYGERRINVLAERAKRAMFEYSPIRPSPEEEERIYRSFRYGPSLEVFLLDERSYRGPNSGNKQPLPSSKTAFLGRTQLAWLKQALANSTATWKVIATDMPLSLVVGDGVHGGVRWFDAWANGQGPPLGREFELAELLRCIKARHIENLVFLTADVHYAAAHYYNPLRAKLSGFLPFWEFVAGPLHASTYGPNRLDPTFGPEIRYQSPPSGKRLRSPYDGGQYFGDVCIDGGSEVMTVTLRDLYGAELYHVELSPSR